MKFMPLPIVAFVALLGNAQSQLPDFEPRYYYGSPLEPKATVLHGAGQCMAGSFRDYAAAVGSQLTPVFFMDYAGLKQFNSKTGAAESLKGTRQLLTEYPDLMLQLGLRMTTDGYPKTEYAGAVASGEMDHAIQNFCDEIKNLGCPVLLRIGYECNGPWNGYHPKSYKKAFRRIAKAIRRNHVNAATVWCVYPVNLEEAMPYYPGSKFVDWWSMDLFFPDDLSSPKTSAFLDAAQYYKRPVLIGECTPRNVGANEGEISWNNWYAPFFALLAHSPGIKGFGYINWNWIHFPQWKDWGDARVETNPVVTKNLQNALKSPLFKHQGTQLPQKGY